MGNTNTTTYHRTRFTKRNVVIGIIFMIVVVLAIVLGVTLSSSSSNDNNNSESSQNNAVDVEEKGQPQKQQVSFDGYDDII